MYVAAAGAGLRSVTRKGAAVRWSAVPVLSRRAKWKVESGKVEKAKVIRQYLINIQAAGLTLPRQPAYSNIMMLHQYE